MTPHPILTLALLALPSLALAQDIPVSPDASMEGPWVEVPAGYVAPYTGPLTPEDIATLADLDGNPSVTTDEEAEMILVLSQVLLSSPLDPEMAEAGAVEGAPLTN